MTQDKLIKLGLNDFFLEQVHDDIKNLGRILSENKQEWIIKTGSLEILKGSLTGKHRKEFKNDPPGVGDWVVFSPQKFGPEQNQVIIEKVLKRKSFLKRQSSGSEQKSQLLAANVDIAFLVSSLNQDFNIRRLERYISLCIDGGVTPPLLLTKRDLVTEKEAQEKMLKLQTEIQNSDFKELNYFISSTKDPLYSPLSFIRDKLKNHKTGVLPGSSGSGKSSIINLLFNKEMQKTQNIRNQDDKGRHTTTSRELFELCGDSGGLLIDTPGLREIRLDLKTNEDLIGSFPEIDSAAKDCRFKNCQHLHEPGCSVKTLVSEGRISSHRYQSYLKLKDEIQESMKKRRGF